MTTADPQLQTQVLYAPFVKADDKIQKIDVADMSLSDFYPKRLALSYEPAMIGKLVIFKIKPYSTLTSLSLNTLFYAPITFIL